MGNTMKDVPRPNRLWSGTLTVGDLRRKLENIRDDVPVVLESSDHSYVSARHAVMKLCAMDYKTKEMSEFHDYSHLLDGEGAEVVFIIFS